MSLDELSRGLAKGTISRRRALTILGASAAAALFPFARSADATVVSDECRYDNECGYGEECRYGKCVPRNECRYDNECGYGEECRYGKCVPKAEKPKRCPRANCEKKVHGKKVADHSKCPRGCKCKKVWVGNHKRFKCSKPGAR